MLEYDNLEGHLTKFKPDARKITLDSYIKYLENLHKSINGMRDFENFKWLKKFDSVMEKISEKSYLTQRNILNAVIVGLHSVKADNDLIEKYVIVRDKHNMKYRNDRQNSVANAKQDKNMITIEELDEIINDQEKYIKFFKCNKKTNLSIKEYLDFQIFVILKFYQKYALRNDMVTLRFRTKSGYAKSAKDYNVYLPNEKEIILSEYKTSGKYGVLKIDIDKDINNLMKCLIKQQQNFGFDNPDNYLLMKANGKPYSKVEFSNLLINFFKKKIGKSISTTLLRKIFLSKYSDVKAQMAEDARVMSHSTAVQSSVYIPK